MSLAARSRAGVYEVDGLIGSGGVGEVFRATGSRLLRDVAIKVLPDDFAADPTYRRTRARAIDLLPVIPCD